MIQKDVEYHLKQMVKINLPICPEHNQCGQLIAKNKSASDFIWLLLFQDRTIKRSTVGEIIYRFGPNICQIPNFHTIPSFWPALWLCEEFLLPVEETKVPLKKRTIINSTDDIFYIDRVNEARKYASENGETIVAQTRTGGLRFL